MTPRVAVVTGGANGLGEVIVRHLHTEGHRVAVADVDSARAATLAAELGPNARGYPVDVRDREALKALLSAVLTDFGAVHVLVNNAARTQAKPLMDITQEDLDDVMAVNLSGTFYASQIFGAHLAAQGGGRIINLASLAGQNGGTATGGHYAASKGAVLAATKVFARELAPYGVTVNAISPGPQDTPMVRAIIGEDNLDSFTSRIPLGTLGDPTLIAHMVALLASPHAATITGVCWDANGGLHMR
ncbi:3-oxoacyl-ACP reductase [Actinophytocola xinjiangensis]|uniref:3-oxoacyl-ACP reductase n=1 Tax=Actinophytocola xinjiangensis TaxID=485602 RepID=A0A7Z0WQ88_9PSEU|nr:SDR family oxidoreductase [Actinophytocola xinjiangensis]OLF12283.1 3-oxoacyl-ACP reductase [Actinophytocola xinjiangensis]